MAHEEEARMPRSGRWLGVFLFISLTTLLVLENSALWESWKHLAGKTEMVNLRRQEGPEEGLGHPLGTFSYRPVAHRAVSCSKINTFSTVKPLECEGMNGTRTVEVNGTVMTANTCGSIPLVPGLCLISKESTYSYNEPVYKRLSQLVEKSVKCNSSTKLDKGYFSNFRYHGPGCQIADLNSRWLNSKFQTNIIVFIGDSHARNLFTAFVAEVRNQKYIAERHPDFRTKALKPYQRFDIYLHHDHLQDLIGSESLKHAEVRTTNCDKQKRECPVTVLYLWAATPREYESLLTGTLLEINPHVIITDFVSRTYTGELGFDKSMDVTMNLFENFFSVRPDIPFVVAPFPFAGGEIVSRLIRDWINRRTVKARAAFINQTELVEACFRVGMTLMQLKRTYHSVCAFYDNFSFGSKVPENGGHKVAGYESCVVPIDRAVVRLAFTLAAYE